MTMETEKLVAENVKVCLWYNHRGAGSQKGEFIVKCLLSCYPARGDCGVTLLASSLWCSKIGVQRCTYFKGQGRTIGFVIWRDDQMEHSSLDTLSHIYIFPIQHFGLAPDILISPHQTSKSPTASGCFCSMIGDQLYYVLFLNEHVELRLDVGVTAIHDFPLNLSFIRFHLQFCNLCTADREKDG